MIKKFGGERNNGQNERLANPCHKRRNLRKYQKERRERFLKPLFFCFLGGGKSFLGSASCFLSLFFIFLYQVGAHVKAVFGPFPGSFLTGDFLRTVKVFRQFLVHQAVDGIFRIFSVFIQRTGVQTT